MNHILASIVIEIPDSLTPTSLLTQISAETIVKILTGALATILLELFLFLRGNCLRRLLILKDRFDGKPLNAVLDRLMMFEWEPGQAYLPGKTEEELLPDTVAALSVATNLDLPKDNNLQEL